MPLTDEPEVVGVIGGGQLCRMMGEAASPLGFEIVFLDPTPNAPAKPVTRKQIVGDFDDRDAVKRLLNYADYLTYDIELADPELIRSIDPQSPVHPHPGTLEMIQDKLNQKQTLREAGIPVPEFRKVDNVKELKSAGDDLGYPLMVKSRHGGYDGRGNFHLPDEDAVSEAFEALSGKLMVEEFIDYERELSVIGVKNSDTVKLYPPTLTVHEDEILRHTLTPAPISETVANRACEVARDTLELLDGRGVFGIELFHHGDSILLNEIAPRPHNSGHWTIEGAVTSQFENHIRAVTDCPLGSTELIDPTVTVNILGTNEETPVHLDGEETILEASNAHLHWYGKELERPLRKMGHFTLTGDRADDELIDDALALKEELRFQP